MKLPWPYNQPVTSLKVSPYCKELISVTRRRNELILSYTRAFKKAASQSIGPGWGQDNLLKRTRPKTAQLDINMNSCLRNERIVVNQNAAAKAVMPFETYPPMQQSILAFDFFVNDCCIKFVYIGLEPCAANASYHAVAKSVQPSPIPASSIQLNNNHKNQITPIVRQNHHNN